MYSIYRLPRLTLTFNNNNKTKSLNFCGFMQLHIPEVVSNSLSFSYAVYKNTHPSLYLAYNRNNKGCANTKLCLPLHPQPEKE